ncbi:uncharacterized protein LOC126883017 isoform X1 [Diabrotica virgifera virgifera]|uniref:MATH and LRR domain-containing protein PFE0570w-like n=1 Tax=Diabrotica virgifera virgifera TaxID=50390 RepID=A0ABM5K1S8_DIAVI|nr:uncharacterized protein LOC126883017 isoform X1 [Diabrotica virgifera virgifera]
MSDKKMEKKPSRTSILKPRKSINQSDLNDSNSEVPARDARRVSFASSNFVKPFAADPEKNTIWDNTYEEEVNHTDSTSETKGFLDKHSVNALTFNDGNEEIKAEPFFIGQQNTSVRSLSINTTNIDEFNKENYVPVILKNPFVAEGSIHVHDSMFKTEMKTSKIQFTDLDSIQTQNQENTMELTCMSSILPNNNISVENTTQDMELTDISLKLTDFAPTSNLFYTQTVKRFESDLNKENIVDFNIPIIADNNLTNVLPTTNNTQKVPDFFQNPELFRKNKIQELEITIVDQTNTVACPDMQLTCTHSKEDNNIPEKDFNNSEISMEITSDILVDESKNVSMINVENSGATMQLTQIVSTNNNGHILERSLGNREVNDTKKDNDTSSMDKRSVYAGGNCEKSSENTTKNNIDTSMKFTCVFPPIGQLISSNINDIKTDMDNSMQMTCVHPDTSKIIKKFADMGNQKSSDSITSKNTDSSMQFTCVFPNPSRIISNNVNDTKTDIDNSMHMTCIHPDTSQIIKNFADVGNEKGSESITSKNIDPSMQFTCVFPNTGQIISNNINDTKTDIDNSMQMTCIHSDTSQIIKNFADVGNEKDSESITSKNIDTSMPFTCVFPNPDQIISNKIKDTKTDMDNNMQMTCIHPDTSQIIENFADVGNEKGSESITSKNIDTSMQFTCVFPNPDQIISNKIKDTKTEMDNNMQMTCIHPDTSQIIENFADVGNEKGSESITSKNIDTSMQFTCVFPNPDQIISNKIKDTKTEMDNNMQMTCIHSDTSQIIKNFVDVGNEKGSESITNKNIDTSMQFTCVFPTSGQSNINGTDKDNSMQMTCTDPNTSKINENFADMGSEGNTNKNLDTSMQFPPTDQIMSNNIHDIRQASMKLEEIVPNNVHHSNRDIDTSVQISCQFPESNKSVKTSSNKNIITKTSEENTNKSFGTSMQLTCVFPQPEDDILVNYKSYSGTVNCENSNIQLTNEIVCKDAVNTDTSMVSKRNINGTLCDITIDKTAGVHATVCDMSIDETHNLEDIAVTYVIPNDGTNQKITDNLSKNLCNMSIDETHNLEGMAVTYVVPNDGTNQKIRGNPIKNECNMSIDETHHLEAIAITYVVPNDGTDQKIIDNPSKNATIENGTNISDRVDNIKPYEQAKDEEYLVPIKKTKFADTLQHIAYTDQEHTGVDEYKRKTQEKSLEGGAISKTQIKKSCEEDNMRSEHKIFPLENDEDSKMRLKENKHSFAGKIQENPTVSKILTRSREQFLKFREEFNSAKQKQDNTTTNLAEIKDRPVLIHSNEEDIDKTPVEMPTYAQSKNLQLCEDFNIKKRVELEYNVAEHQTSAGIFKSPVPTCDDPLVSSHVLTRSKHALLQPGEDYNLKTSKINNKMNILEEDTELKLTTSGIVTRSRNKVLKSCDDLKPKHHEDHDKNNDNANISKDSSCIQYPRGDHVSLSDNNSMDESFKTNEARLTSPTNKGFPSIVESRLKTTDKSEINAGHLLIPRIQEEFGPNDTTLTVYDSSSLKESSVTSNDYQNSQEAKSTNSQLSNNLLDCASNAGKPAFSFDIGRSSTLVNRTVINDDDEIVDTCNLKKEKIMRLNSDVLRMDDASSSFALMLSNSPYPEYPGKKIYSTRTRPLLGVKRDDSTTEEYSKYEINPVLTNEERKESVIANIEVEPTTHLNNTPKNQSLLLCDTSPVIVDMTIDDEYIQETDKSKIDTLKTRLSNSFNQHPSEYSISLAKLLDEYQQCLTLPNIEIPETDNDLIIKFDSVSKKTEQLLKNLNFYKRDVVDLEELDKLENFGSSSTSRFSEEMLSADCVSNNTGEDTGWGDMTVSKSLEDKIKEAASRSDRYWEYVKADDEFYYFYTYYRVVPFKVKVHPDSGIVDKIYTYTNLIDNPEPLFCYNSKFLLEKLKNENLLLALGGKFDLVTLLDYISICMEEIIDFSTEFNKLKVEYGPTHKFRMNSDSSVCVEVVHIKYVIWWVITIELSIHNLGSIDHITAKQIYEEIDEKQIQSLGKNFSGSLQLRNFIINLDQHVEKVGKRVLAYRQNELLT